MTQTLQTRPIEVKPPKDGLDLLLEKNDSDPIQQMPDSTKYYAIPEKRTHLRSFIQSFHWNYCAKEITMCIDETPKFTAFEWFTLDDLGSLTLIFMDANEKEISRLTFDDLTLLDHSCGCYTQTMTALGEFNPLQHHLTIRFGKCEICEKNQEDDKNAEPDSEWITEDLNMATSKEDKE